MVLFIRHLIYDVLVKKTIDKVLRLIRKLDWEDEEVCVRCPWIVFRGLMASHTRQDIANTAQRLH